jgi:hypothetical protein
MHQTPNDSMETALRVGTYGSDVVAYECYVSNNVDRSFVQDPADVAFLKEFFFGIWTLIALSKWRVCDVN